MSSRHPNILGPAERGDLSTVRRLLQQDDQAASGSGGTRMIDITDRNGRSALVRTAAQGRLDILAELLQWGPDLDRQDERGLTALMVASDFGGHTKVCAMLLSAGASVNAKAASGRTALHKAAYYGHVAVCELLIAHGAELDAVNELGSTPIIGAARNGHEAVVQLLIKHGACLSIRNRDGKRAVDYCKTFVLRKQLIAEERWQRRRYALLLTSPFSGKKNILYKLPEDLSRFIATML